MATSQGGVDGVTVSFKASGDLSDNQFWPVKLTAASTVGTCSDETDQAIGILQNKPEAASSPADVQLFNGGGISKVVTSGTIAAAGLVYIGTDGKCRAPLTADVAPSRNVGYAVEASTTTAASGGGDIISVVLDGAWGTAA